MSASVTAERLNEGGYSEWQEFLHASNNGTIFHDLDFLAYHPPDRFDVHHLLFRRRGNLLALFPAAIVRHESKAVLRSPYGASVGGFVTREGVRLDECLELVDALVEYATGVGVDAVEMTTVPTIYHATPHHHLDFALFTQGFTYVRRLLVSALDLASIVGDPMDAFEGRMRTAIRKALKAGVMVAESDQWRAFYDILLENKAKHGATPTHTLEELLDLKQRLPERVRLYLGYAEGRPVAGVLVFICNRRVATTFYICHLASYQACNPVSLVLHQVVQEYWRQGFRYLDLGPSVAPDMAVQWGVLKFKESLGTRGYFRDTWWRGL